MSVGKIYQQVRSTLVDFIPTLAVANALLTRAFDDGAPDSDFIDIAYSLGEIAKKMVDVGNSLREPPFVAFGFREQQMGSFVYNLGNQVDKAARQVLGYVNWEDASHNEIANAQDHLREVLDLLAAALTTI